jgi:ATP-dependent Clp protease ATP-binding subunit ClpB
LNRIDEIVFFHSLGHSHLVHIIEIQLRQLSRRLEERKVGLAMTDAAKALLVDEGFDPTYGARPLKRTIQRRVLDPLAMRILQGEFVEADHVMVDVTDGEIAFRKEEPVVV